mmetsp:Transcript_69014/g.128910  ORF Transcript_69014/g.128910 Transcript_69014/m.128910 type:complete len:333 (+) Transcript_69014:77-1075(+)
MEQAVARRIAVVGLGSLGSAFVANLLKAGEKVVGYDLQPKPHLESLGMQTACNVGEAVKEADVLITALPAPRHVYSVMEDGGLLQMFANATKARSVASPLWIDHTSVDPGCGPHFGAASAAVGVRYVEAPLTGGLTLLKEGKMTVYLGGETSDLDLAEAIVCHYVGKALRLGPWGAPATVKIVSNQLAAVNAVCIGEAMSIFRKSDIPLPTAFDAIRASAGNTYVWETEGPLAMNGTYDPGFALALHNKDLRIGHQISTEAGIPTPVFDAAHAVYERAMEAYGPDAGSSHPAKLIASEAQVSLDADGFRDWTYTVQDVEGSLGVLHRKKAAS